MKKLILLLLLICICSTVYSKSYKYRRHKCRVAQNHLQYEHSKPACKDPQRRERNWQIRPKNDALFLIIKKN